MIDHRLETSRNAASAHGRRPADLRREITEHAFEKLSRVRGNMTEAAFTEAVESVVEMRLRDLERSAR